MVYITATQAAEIPALEQLDDQGRQQALADAERVYRYLRRNEFIADSDLRAYGDRNDLPADRLNVALAVLDQTGRVLHIPEADQ